MPLYHVEIANKARRKDEHTAMDEIPILGHDDEAQILKRFVAHYDAPAYMRRARQVQEAFEQMLERCRHERDELLQMVRLRLGVLHGLAGTWDKLRPWLKSEHQLRSLQDLYSLLDPELHVAIEPTSSSRTLYRALRELTESIERFNRRWRELLQKVDLTKVNELREGYNRYYVLEKECALRSPRLARQGYSPLPPVTVEELRALLPPLAVPELRKPGQDS